MGFLLVPLFVSAVFFLAVCLRDLRGDFRERTHQFEDLDPWESPPRETRLAAEPQARDLIRRIIGVGLVAVTALTMMVALGMLSSQVTRTERHWSDPRLTLMVIPFEALGDDASQRSMANTLNKGLKRELASWDGLDFIPVKTAFMAQRQTVDADQRGARLRPRYALEGSVLRTNETVSIRARLFDARTARDVWSAQLNADPADHSKILAELTSGVASALDNELAR